jgi:hypothetical protein
MITYIRSLVGQPFQYYSCFISYSSHDEALAQRLHADLHDNGVRCWSAPEDLKIGDEFRPRIDESIQMYDRLLLILSESCMLCAEIQCTKGMIRGVIDRSNQDPRRSYRSGVVTPLPG